VDAANRVEAAIFGACAFVAESPLRGHTRADLTALPVRFWTVQPYRNYLIVFDPATDPLQVLRVLHGARNFQRILAPPL
jgi:plasmid stabilization system protein ParE